MIVHVIRKTVKVELLNGVRVIRVYRTSQKIKVEQNNDSKYK